MTTQHTPSEYDGMLIPSCARTVPIGSCGFTGGYGAAPHECDDAECPGNVNRLKLEAFDDLLRGCKFLLNQCGEHNIIDDDHEGDYIHVHDTIAKAEKLA
jgi:hypothetical protein